MMRKISALIAKLSPLLLLLGVWFAFSYPYFLHGKVPFPSTYLVNHFHPWSIDQKNWGPVKNGAMPDIIDQLYPWKHFSIEEWKSGRIPWWNSNSFAGNPHIANVQSSAFSPMNTLFFFLPFLDAWSLLILFQPLIAAFGMYLLLRFYKITRSGSIIGSIAWMFSGFIVVWMAYGTLSMAIAVLPLALYLLSVFVASGKKIFGLLFSLTLMSSFFSGHFQTSLYLFLVCLGYVIFLIWKEKKRYMATVFFIVLGLVLSLPQLLPAVQLYNLSPRSDIFLFSGGIPFYYLVTFFAPDFFGNPVTRNDWFGYYAEWSSFVGILPIFFASFTITLKAKKEIVFYQILLLLSLIFSIESPILKLLGGIHLPVLSTSSPSRLIVIASFSFCVLAGFGYDRIREGIMSSIKNFLQRTVSIFFLLIIVFGLTYVHTLFSAEHAAIARKNVILPVVVLFSSLVVIVIAHLVRKRAGIFRYFIFLLVLLVAADSLRFASKWMPFDPRQYVYPHTSVVAAMQSDVGNGRVFGNIGAQVGTYYNIPLIEGYDPLYIDRYGEFIRASATGNYSPSERSVVKIDRDGKYLKRVLDLLDVSIIYHPNADTNQPWAFHVWNDKDFVPVYHDDLYTLYKNTKAISRPSLYYAYEVISDKRKLLSRFYSENFNYRQSLLLEDDPGILPQSTIGKGSVRVVSDTPTSLKYEIESNEDGLLFLADNYYPGWKVKVNSTYEKIFRADYTFRAVKIPKGKSTVQFFYDFLF